MKGEKERERERECVCVSVSSADCVWTVILVFTEHSGAHCIHTRVPQRGTAAQWREWGRAHQDKGGRGERRGRAERGCATTSVIFVMRLRFPHLSLLVWHTHTSASLASTRGKRSSQKQARWCENVMATTAAVGWMEEVPSASLHKRLEPWN